MALNCDSCEEPVMWIVRNLEAPGFGPHRAACRAHATEALFDALRDGTDPDHMAPIEVTLVAPPPSRGLKLTLPPAAVTAEPA